MKNNVVGAVSKPTSEELVRMYETFDDGQSKDIRRQLREGALHTKHVQALIEHRPVSPETIDFNIIFWTGLYAVVFEIDAKADLFKLNWPEPDPNFWDVPMVKGITETRALNALKRWNKFPVGSYYDDPSSVIDLKNTERHPSRGTYGVRFHADPEGDEDQKNISGNKHKKLGTKGNTSLEAEVLEPMFFLKSSGNHLNRSTVNHAIGGRFSDGDVPGTRWCDDKFCLDYGYPPGLAYPGLRARVAVVTF
ncbi:MAG: hypothetical protein COV91_05775 [Candidatus Taylorbacteria bacterium CG11_big_fil_rev_8_21_14_0_20_46_11]|uniref:Uncharacterized protein n=1 Tax=Candidatus Taylorbacteria bacterium CG11_big_fil_rev_8_21_14_0_20_46_11 TaxID=1975025 RepID=A0A2H0KCK0_9BACT|nr:MAG: hypothetical protein COV91_05775 [Candidatus Taylorbacteria bacterium CG11_big_fil_rev_8_21_14_0_20_46_11]